MTVFVFPDTNVWLHFRPLEQVDWNTTLADPDVRFVATPPLVRELDQRKSAPRTRDRARRALRVIESWAEHDLPVQLRLGVTGQVWLPPWVPDAAALGLDPNHSDDVMVAYAKTFHQHNATARVIVLTDDSGPRLTARRLGLEPFAPPESAREPSVDDTSDGAEARRLRAELDSLKNRMPRLSLRLKEGAGEGTRLEVMLPVDAPVTQEAYVRKAEEEAEVRAPEILTPTRSSERKPEISEQRTGGVDLAYLSSLASFQRSQLFPIAASEYERYAADRDRYLSEVTRTATSNWMITQELRRTLIVDLVLKNSGTAPAEDIDVAIHVPDGPDVSEEAPSLLEQPAVPVKPRTLMELMAESVNHSFLHRAFDLSPSHQLVGRGQVRNVSDPTIRRSNSYDIRVHVNRLKQHESVDLARIALLYPAPEGLRSLTLSYRLNSATLPQPVIGELHVVVSSL